MQGSHARLPGSSLMCCHKTCSWQRLNVQWDSELLQHTEPWVLPFQLSPNMFLIAASVYCQSRIDLTFSAPSQHSISVRHSPSGNLKKQGDCWSYSLQKCPLLSSQNIMTVEGYWFFWQCTPSNVFFRWKQDFRLSYDLLLLCLKRKETHNEFKKQSAYCSVANP